MFEYDYVPLPKRNAIQWPGGKGLALIFTFNLETWDLVKDSDKPYYAGGPAILPDILPGNVADFPNYSWREYGQRVGIWRLIDLFDEMGISASCTANAVTFERRGEMTDAAIERGWELLAHNYEQGELLTAFAHDEAAERDVILRSIETFERHVGKRPMGWLSSSLRGTMNTPGILAEQGFKFYCDIMNDDQPFMIRTRHGPIVGLPYSNVINDFTMVTRQGLTPGQFRDQLIAEFDALYAEGEKTARIMNVGLHPHVTGRAHHIAALREFIAHAQRHTGVWWARREEIADWYAANHAAHFPEQLG
jgi:allantoinase